jgi:transposase InsO family protein
VKCDSCVAAKQRRVTHSRSESRAARSRPDSHRPCPNEEELHTGDGQVYVLTVIDDYSRVAEVAVLQKNSETAEVLRNTFARFERQTGNKVQENRFDRGSEFYRLKDWMAEQGIIPQPMTAGTPEANGRAESLNKTIIERVRALLHRFDLPVAFWTFAVEVVAYTRNLLPLLKAIQLLTSWSINLSLLSSTCVHLIVSLVC